MTPVAQIILLFSVALGFFVWISEKLANFFSKDSHGKIERDCLNKIFKNNK
jgi:uncharacterized membrane protein YoaT (DUF817 family)